jgi:hypothetical protein
VILVLPPDIALLTKMKALTEQAAEYFEIDNIFAVLTINPMTLVVLLEQLLVFFDKSIYVFRELISTHGT